MVESAPSAPAALAIIAGKGAYPRLLAESARLQGVDRLVAAAFRRETDPAIESVVDRVYWLRLGQLGTLLETLREAGVSHAVMAGQITPTHLFRVRMDRAMLDLLRRLPVRNAQTIFGAVGEALASVGVELLPAYRFMEAHMPPAGVLTRRAPNREERVDIALGLKVARTSSDLDIGQTVVVKEGTVLAVEAFEGTNETIRRAARLGGDNVVVVKVAKRRHDMRFDIPVVGKQTMGLLRRSRAAVLALEAGRAIVLEREAVIRQADRMSLSMLALPPDTEPDAWLAATEGD